MLNIGGFHPITAALGVKPMVMPGFENTTHFVNDDEIGRPDDPKHNKPKSNTILILLTPYFEYVYQLDVV